MIYFIRQRQCRDGVDSVARSTRREAAKARALFWIPRRVSFVGAVDRRDKGCPLLSRRKASRSRGPQRTPEHPLRRSAPSRFPLQRMYASTNNISSLNLIILSECVDINFVLFCLFFFNFSFLFLLIFVRVDVRAGVAEQRAGRGAGREVLQRSMLLALSARGLGSDLWLGTGMGPQDFFFSEITKIEQILEFACVIEADALGPAFMPTTSTTSRPVSQTISRPPGGGSSMSGLLAGQGGVGEAQRVAHVTREVNNIFEVFGFLFFIIFHSLVSCI